MTNWALKVVPFCTGLTLATRTRLTICQRTRHTRIISSISIWSKRTHWTRSITAEITDTFTRADSITRNTSQTRSCITCQTRIRAVCHRNSIVNYSGLVARLSDKTCSTEKYRATLRAKSIIEYLLHDEITSTFGNIERVASLITTQLALNTNSSRSKRESKFAIHALSIVTGSILHTGISHKGRALSTGWWVAWIAAETIRRIGWIASHAIRWTSATSTTWTSENIFITTF